MNLLYIIVLLAKLYCIKKERNNKPNAPKTKSNIKYIRAMNAPVCDGHTVHFNSKR